MRAALFQVVLFKLFLWFSGVAGVPELEDKIARLNLRGHRRLLDESTSWKDRVKEKGETVFQEKKRAAIRAACYKDWSAPFARMLCYTGAKEMFFERKFVV